MGTKDRVKKIRAKTGLSQVKFSETYGIPRRTLEDWERGISIPPEYVLDLLEFKISEDLSKKN